MKLEKEELYEFQDKIVECLQSGNAVKKLYEIKKVIEEIWQSGRVSRDLEVQPIIEKVNRFIECPGCNDFSMVMNNLKEV